MSPDNDLIDFYLFKHRHEFKSNHKEWIESVKPTLESAISTEIQEVVEIEETEIENCKSIRNEMRSAINSLLKVIFLAYCCSHSVIIFKNVRFLVCFVFHAYGC